MVRILIGIAIGVYLYKMWLNSGATVSGFAKNIESDISLAQNTVNAPAGTAANVPVTPKNVTVTTT